MFRHSISAFLEIARHDGLNHPSVAGPDIGIVAIVKVAMEPHSFVRIPIRFQEPLDKLVVYPAEQEQVQVAVLPVGYLHRRAPELGLGVLQDSETIDIPIEE